MDWYTQKYSIVSQVLILIFLCGRLALCDGHVHMHYDNNVYHHAHVKGYNDHDGGGNTGDGGYSVDDGGTENGDDEEMHNDGNSYFMGHPTGVAVHPLSLMNKPGGNMSDQKSDDKVTDILHGLLAKYDNRIRPFLPDRPTMITVAILDFQVVDVDELKSELSSTVLLQQTWMDLRLAYDLTEHITEVPYITISHDHTRELWLPDTFFINEKKAQIHEMTMTNDAVVLFGNGSVVRSTRITVSTFCPFNYKNFPFESQQCELLIGSHGYSETDIELFWDENYIVKAESLESNSSWKNVISNVHTGKFLVTSMDFNETTEKLNLGIKSRLSLQINLQRTWKPFLTRFYLPMTLFVFVSLGTLFLNDFKVALIVNLFNLAFVNIFIAIRSTGTDAPSTSTRTSLDVFFILCLTYILISIMITVYKLIRLSQQDKARPVAETTTSPGQTTFTAERRISSNRRRQADQLDIFNPMNHTSREEESIAAGSSSNHHFHNGLGNDGESSLDHEGESGSEYERIYRSPTYPLHFSSRTRVVLRKTGKFMSWLGKYLRWILLISYLLMITDYFHFKTRNLQI